MKLAEALLLRKEYARKVEQLKPVKMSGEQGIFEVKTQRRQVSENVDEVITQIPKVTLAEVTREFDYYATELRKLDAKIQEANWKFDIDYSQPKKPE